MRVNVRFLSYLATLAGTEQVELDLPEAARVGDLTHRLQEMYPEHASLFARVTYLVDQAGVHADTVLEDGAQVLALLTLSGG